MFLNKKLKRKIPLILKWTDKLFGCYLDLVILPLWLLGEVWHLGQEVLDVDEVVHWEDDEDVDEDVDEEGVCVGAMDMNG